MSIRGIYWILFCLMLWAGKGYAQTAFIPDPVFRQYLVTNYSWLMDANQELIIAGAESHTGEFYCSEADINNLDGIQHFKNIDRLKCFRNKLTVLPDLSGLTKLTEIHCFDNQLTSLPPLAGLIHLQVLNTSGNKLTVFPDLSGLTELKELSVFRNELTVIPDLSAFIKLERLLCFENKITSIGKLPPSVTNLLAGTNFLTVLPDISLATGLKELSVYRNRLTAIPDLTAFTQLESFVCFENQITHIGKMPASLNNLLMGNNFLTEFPDISLATGLKEIAAYSNRLTSIPDLAPYTALTKLNLGTNRIPDVHNSLAGLTLLTDLTLDNNLLSSLPDLSALAQLAFCKLNDNQFTFEDLLPSSVNPNFSAWLLTPQDSIPVAAIYKGTGYKPLNIALNIDASVPDLTYSWYQNGILKTQTSQPVLTIPSLQKQDNGIYYCRVSSSDPTFGTFTVTTSMFQVRMLPQFVAEKELVLTPNGDGKNDELLFEESGSLQVYDASGILLDQQTAPCYWNGTTQSGKELSTGYYIIRVNDTITYEVTVIR